MTIYKLTYKKKSSYYSSIKKVAAKMESTISVYWRYAMPESFLKQGFQIGNTIIQNQKFKVEKIEVL